MVCLIEEIGSDALKAFQLAAKPWSPSALQQYARCPYHFALHGIFGLRPQERPEGIQRLDPATRGQIFHEVQFQLLRDGGENALQRLDAVLCEITERWKDELAPAIPQIWDSEVPSLRADLRGWLQRRAESESSWMPIAAELSFGLADPADNETIANVDASVAFTSGAPLCPDPYSRPGTASNPGVVDLNRGKMIQKIPVGEKPLGMTAHPNGRRMYVCVGGSRRIPGAGSRPSKPGGAATRSGR